MNSNPEHELGTRNLEPRTAASSVLVTGSSGFAGGHLLEHLGGGPAVVAWTRSAPPPEVAHLASWTTIDLLDRDRVRDEIGKLRPTEVYHCAGAPHVGHSWQNASQPLANNVLATHYLLDALRRSGHPCRVVLTGSAAVYAPSLSPLGEDHPATPNSPYGLSKLAQEQLGLRTASEDGLEVIVSRAFNHTGPRQRPEFAAPSMARQIALIERGRLEPTIQVGNLDTVRDLTDVRDTVRAYALLMKRGTPGVVYNVASGIGRVVRAILDALVARSRVPVHVTLDPERLRPNDTPVVVGDFTRLRNATGWEPSIPFDQTLDDLLEFWRRTVSAA